MDTDGWTDGRTTKGKEQNEMGDRPRTITFKAKIDLRTILDAHRIMLALKGAILSVTPPSGRLGMKTCACGSAGARALSLSRRACVRARPCPPPSGGSSRRRRRRRRWKRTKGLKCFLFNAASFIGGTNERTSERLAMLPGCQQPACRLPASGSRQLARQPAGGGGEGEERRERGLGLASLLARSLYHFNISER